MPQTRDLFFDEFCDELERVVSGISAAEEREEAPPLLMEAARERWRPYVSDPGNRGETLVSVDGGVQFSTFAYGDFVAVGRACALVHGPGGEHAIEKRVRVHVDEVYDDRDRGFIPGYVRMIAEYEAARAGAERALRGGGRPLVLLDGSLYLSRFPYAIREYQHHSDLLADLFSSIAALHSLSWERGFPVAAVAKDSAVFYLYMELLKGEAARRGLWHLTSSIEAASSPMDLRTKMASWQREDRAALEPLLEARPLCDTALIHVSTAVEGFSHPLLLAPSIYYGRGDTPDLYRRIRRTIEPEKAERAVSALKAFFASPGVAVTYWKPARNARPFRVDVSAAALGYVEPWEGRNRNAFVEEDRDLSSLKLALDHLGHWFCNDLEYNIPLRHADTLARFDRALYESKYRPFIVRRLEHAGLDVEGGRRYLREASL